MFPITDEMGRVIGFSGRVMQKNARVAKYVNSPETSLFHKNRILFALDKARKDILEAREAVICEGQIDVIRCHEAGFTTAIAAQGTALTEAHARIVKRYADAVVLVLDSDRAGQDAAMRGAEVLLAEGLAVRAVALPEGEDPDSLIVSKGADAFRELLAGARSIIDYQVDILAGREQADSEVGALRITRAVLATVARVPERTQQERLLRQAAARLGVSEAALWEDLRRARRRQPRARSETAAPETSRPPVVHPREEVTLAELLATDPGVAGLVRDYLPLEHLQDGYCRVLVQALQEGGDVQARLADQAERVEDPDEFHRLASAVLMAPRRVVGEDRNCTDAARDTILVIRRKSVERLRRDLQQRLPSAPPGERERLEAECRQATLDINLLRGGWDHALPLLEGM
jgi:DNA primase